MRRRQPGNQNASPRKAATWTLMDRPGRTSILLLIVGLGALALFRTFPQIDLWASAAFYAPEACSTVGCSVFFIENSAFWQSVREIGLSIPRYFIIGVAIWLLWQLFGPGQKSAAKLAPAVLATGSAFIGPLLIVNWILKELWGRPRPIQTINFGGDGFYIAPGTISQQCESNCSFVSGEAAAAFWMVWIVVLLPRKWRRPVLAIILALATFISVLRIAFGRHYISDVTMSAFIAIITLTTLAWALQTTKGRRTIARLADWANGLLARRRNPSV